MRLKTGCLATAATRPLISPKTMIPIVEMTKALISAKPNVEPACAAKTSWLMSTNPPTAVMIPSVSSSGFKTVLDLLEHSGLGAQFLRRRIVGLREQRFDQLPVAAVRLAQRRCGSLQLLSHLLVHYLDESRRELALRRLLVDHRPPRRERPGLGAILEVRLRPPGAAGDKDQEQQQRTPHGPFNRCAGEPFRSCYAVMRRPFDDRVRKVIENRRRSPGVMPCSHS